MQDYQPILCQHYDTLELLASRQQPTTVVYTLADGSSIRKEGVRLQDLQSIQGEEFLWLDDGSQPIRLDQLQMVGDENFTGHCTQ